MREEIERYFQRLENLSTRELAHAAETVARREKRNVAVLIAHLAEISKRRAHLLLGYKSLFEYCVRHLRLSEGSAWSRIQVANVARRFPQVLVHLAEGKVSLSVLGLLSPQLEGANVERLLSEAEGKTKREIKEYLAGLEPKETLEPMIRRKPVKSEDQLQGGDGALEFDSQRAEKSGGSAASETGSSAEGTAPEPQGTLEAARPEVYNFRFSADKTFKEKLERLGEVLGIRNPARHMAKIFEKALDLALERKDPQKKLERRKKREAARSKPSLDDVASKGERERKGEPAPRRSRYTPSALRERHFERASYQCEYRGLAGVRCTERTGLEIDHIEPYAKGGTTDETNLRVLCRSHNLFLAAEEFGEEFVGRKVEQKRRRTSSTPPAGRCTVVQGA